MTQVDHKRKKKIIQKFLLQVRNFMEVQFFDFKTFKIRNFF